MAIERKTFTCGESGRYKIEIKGELGTRNYTATVYDTQTKKRLFKRMMRAVNDLSKLLEGVPTLFVNAVMSDKGKGIDLVIQYESAHNNNLPLKLP